METIKQLVAAQFDDYVKDLETITNIDSGTGDAEGSQKVAEFLRPKLEAAGAQVEARTNERATHLIARFKGNGKLKILMIAHTDTVFAKGEAQKRPFRINDDFLAYGPGVGDNKATVMQTVYVMQILNKLNYKDYGEIIIYYDAEEEADSQLADEIIIELAKQVDLAIIMNTARPNWGIVTKRKGIARYEIKVEGIAGHAGNVPYNSASAVMELGNQLTLLYQMASPLPKNPLNFTPQRLAEKGILDCGQFIPENTINVGIIGTTNNKANIVPDNAYAKLEVRSYRLTELERLDKEIKALANQTVVPGTKVKVTGKIGVGPMEKTDKVQKLVDLYTDVVQREYCIRVMEWVAGGISSGNMAAQYVPTIDALGVENENEHTDHETADLKTVEPRTVALICFIKELVNRWFEQDE